MFLRRLLGALIVSALAMPAIADNTVTLPATTRLLVVDGKDASDQRRVRELTLGNGRHQVVFQLRSLVRDGSESDMFTSSPYIMTFDLSGDQAFTIKAPTLRTRRDAENLSQSPGTLITLTNQQGEKTPFEFGVLNRRGLLIGGDIVEDIQKFNLSDNPAAMRAVAGTVYVAAGSSNKQVLSLPPVSAEASSTDQAMSENMLQYWYNQADEETRARFLRWVAESQSSER